MDRAILLSFLFLVLFSFTLSLKCYVCTYLDCGDPYTPDNSHVEDCGSFGTFCFKAKESKNGIVVRGCSSYCPIDVNATVNCCSNDLCNHSNKTTISGEMIFALLLILSLNKFN